MLGGTWGGQELIMRPRRVQSRRGCSDQVPRCVSLSSRVQISAGSNKTGSHQIKTRVSKAATQTPTLSYNSMTSPVFNQKVGAFTCSGCNKPIKRDKFLLKACDKYWHENCLRCDRCHTRLGELGSTLYCKSDMNLCRHDYLEMFGETGICSVCEKLISASEMVMRAKQNVYHLECFACQLCSQRFCVGDRFYLCENKVVCQYDYEEHILPIKRSLLQESDCATAIKVNADNQAASGDEPAPSGAEPTKCEEPQLAELADAGNFGEHNCHSQHHHEAVGDPAGSLTIGEQRAHLRAKSPPLALDGSEEEGQRDEAAKSCSPIE